MPGSCPGVSSAVLLVALVALVAVVLVAIVLAVLVEFGTSAARLGQQTLARQPLPPGRRRHLLTQAPGPSPLCLWVGTGERCR